MSDTMSLRLLLVDDDAAEIDPVAYELRNEGVDVTLVDSTAEAYERLLAKREPYDLVLVDIVMPTEGLFTKEESDSGTLTGLRLIERVKSQRPDLRLGTLTIRGDTALAELLDRAGIRDRYRKPYFTVPLAQQILSLLSKDDRS